MQSYPIQPVLIYHCLGDGGTRCYFQGGTPLQVIVEQRGTVFVPLTVNYVSSWNSAVASSTECTTPIDSTHNWEVFHFDDSYCRVSSLPLISSSVSMEATTTVQIASFPQFNYFGAALLFCFSVAFIVWVFRRHN